MPICGHKMATKKTRQRRHISEKSYKSSPITVSEYDRAVRAMVVSLVKLVAARRRPEKHTLPEKYAVYLRHLDAAVFAERKLVFKYKLWAMQGTLETLYREKASKEKLQKFAKMLSKEFGVDKATAIKRIVVSKKEVASRKDGHSGGPKNYSEEIIAKLILENSGLRVTQKLIGEVIEDPRRYDELDEEHLSHDEITLLSQFTSSLLGPKGIQQQLNPS